VRRHRRYAVKGGVLDVSWLDENGKLRTIRSRILDVSEDGIGLELPSAVMPVLVVLESDKFGLRGKGVVRYCHPKGNKYVAGVKFTGGLHWGAPGHYVQEPIPVCSPVSWPTRLLSQLLTTEIRR
jgi:hypothetical protein